MPERGVAGALEAQVSGEVRRLAGGAPLLVGRAVGGPQVLLALVLVHVTFP